MKVTGTPGTRGPPAGTVISRAYRVRGVSRRPPLARHRLVYAALADMFGKRFTRSPSRRWCPPRIEPEDPVLSKPLRGLPS